MTITKKDMKSLLVKERASMREKQKKSLFMRRTLSVYNAQKKRRGADLPYTLDEFRRWVEADLPLGCSYCQGPLTAKNFTPDHADAISKGGSWDLGNLRLACQSCNWQKGTLKSWEFHMLLEFLKSLPSESATDIKRRLTIGGKWSWK